MLSFVFMQTQSDSKLCNADETSADLLRNFPSLERSTDFFKKSRELGLVALTSCPKLFKKEECYSRTMAFVLAWKSQPSLCSSPEVQRSIFGALALKDGPGRNQARLVAEGTCWEILQARIEKEVDRGPASYLGEQLCQILRAKNKMNEGREAKCHSLSVQPARGARGT
jgi:hypothetical protein